MTIARRLLATALLACLLAPSVAAVAEGARADVHRCTDEVCRCALGHAAADASPARPAPCHEGASASAPAADCQMSARCHHDGPATPAAPEPALTSAARALRDDHAPAPPPPALAGAAQTGFSRIDAPPPRQA